MKRLLFLLPLALTGSVWLPPLGLAPSAAAPMDFAAPATFPSEMPDWRTDPLGAAMAETALVENPWSRASLRADMYLGLMAAGFDKEASTVLEFAVEEALAWPEGAERHNALYGLADSLQRAGRNGQVERLLLLVLEESDAEMLADTAEYWIVPTALAVDSLAVAERAWEGMKESRSSLQRVTLLAPYLAAHGESEEARQVVAEGMAVHRALGWMEPDGSVETHHAVMLYLNAYLEIGEQGLARAMLAEANAYDGEAGDWRDTFYHWLRLARAAHRAGDPSLAKVLVDKSRLLARESARYRWWDSRRDSANWWENFVAEYRVTKWERSSANSALAGAYTQLGMWEEAREAADKVREEGLVPDTLSRLGRALAGDGQESAALELAVMLESLGQGHEGAATVVDAVSRRRLEAGQGEEAWTVWKDHLAPAQHEPPFGLMRYWRAAGELDALLEFLGQESQAGAAAAGARQAALAIEDSGAAIDDAPMLTGLVAMVLGLESRAPVDDINKTSPLIEIARLFHAIGEHSEAVLAMKAAERLVEDWEPGCEIRRYPISPEDEFTAECRSLWGVPPDQEPTPMEQKNLVRPYIAKGWAAIGEFDRAFSLVERMGTLEKPLMSEWSGRFPRLEALRWIGIAMLEQGVAPSAYLDSLVASSR
ncbi:hypothetical protein IIA16_01160 [bacterium]|nr:hypothetical protein [bacterium]